MNHPQNVVASPSRRGMSRRRLLGLSALGVLLAGAGIGSMLAAPLPWESDDIPDWTSADMPDQTGHLAVVTGGNGFPQAGRSGLGFHIAQALARANADVVIASRNVVRGAEAVRQIRSEVPSADIRFEVLDLADMNSVRNFAASLRERGRAIDVLVNNAGVMGRMRREVSVDGFERVLATNTIGHFALTNALRPLLEMAGGARIMWVGSGRTAGALPFDDLNLEERYEYAGAYDNSKLANLMLSQEMNRRWLASGSRVISVAAHPGVALTNLIPEGPGLESAEGWRLQTLPFMFQPAADGALPLLYATTVHGVEPGDYYGPNGFLGIRGLPGRAELPAAARDPAAAARLWDVLEKMTESGGDGRTG